MLRYGVALFGIQTDMQGTWPIMLNPGPSYVLKQSDVCFYMNIAKEENSTFLPTTSTISASQSTQSTTAQPGMHSSLLSQINPDLLAHKFEKSLRTTTADDDDDKEDDIQEVKHKQIKSSCKDKTEDDEERQPLDAKVRSSKRI